MAYCLPEEFRELRDLPASATVLDSHTLEIAGVQHFEDVIGLVPNLNWSAGTSRPRYFQLRGIGELEQWQGAPNPSVGFLIDGIDFVDGPARKDLARNLRFFLDLVLQPIPALRRPKAVNRFVPR
ncbi:Plug domain-containing protein [Lacticaseibacillus rhamnosus]